MSTSTPVLLSLLTGALAVRAEAQCETTQALPVAPANAWFGDSVAIDGKTAAIGANGEEERGSVTILDLDDKGTPADPTDDAWVPTFRIVNSDDALILFGLSVALHGDTLVASAISFTGFTPKGWIRVFERVDVSGTPGDRSDDVWLKTLDRGSPEPEDLDQFGTTLVLEGDELLVGANRASGGGVREGAAYLFRRDDKETPADRLDDDWVFTAKLTAADGFTNAGFGYSVALEGDLALISAVKQGPDSTQTTGAAYVFARDPRNPTDPWDDTWSQTTKLLSSSGIVPESFGSRVALEGTTALVGGLGIYVFEETAGTWLEAHHITNGLDGAELGSADSPAYTSFSARADRFAVCAKDRSVYVFGRDERGTPAAKLDDRWDQELKLVPSHGQSDDGFGRYAVALDDGVVLVGAPHTSAPGYSNSGAAYFFHADPAGMLHGCPPAISLQRGDRHVLNLDASPANAGRMYFLLGSASGTKPGIWVGGVHLPLQQDDYMLNTILFANSPIFVRTFGVFGPTGRATAILDLPTGTAPQLAGLVLDHACLVFDEQGWPILGSEPVPVTLAP